MLALALARLARFAKGVSNLGGRNNSTWHNGEPLRIIFCGSDSFSNHSLSALHKLSIRSPSSISLSVLCRPDKHIGRGRKILNQAPIKLLAQSLDLPLYQIDTFTGWTPPTRYDLVVAVSFGLRVPKRVLDGAVHGGLNVHPSFLPDLKGPAPIQWTLLHGDESAGVTLQTLHPTRIDGGDIIEQTPRPGLAVPARAGLGEMIDLLGAEGARMLVSHVEKLSRGGTSTGSPQTSVRVRERWAPKILPEDRKFDMTWDADTVLLRDRIIGPLWQTLPVPGGIANLDPKRGQRRVSYHGWKEIEIGSPKGTLLDMSPEVCILSFDDRPLFCVKTADDKLLAPIEVTPDGKRRMSNQSFAQSFLCRS